MAQKQQKSPASQRSLRPQITLTEESMDYLELKSSLTGRPVATLIADFVFDGMQKEYSELLKLKRQIEEGRKVEPEVPSE